MNTSFPPYASRLSSGFLHLLASCLPLSNGQSLCDSWSSFSGKQHNKLFFDKLNVNLGFLYEIAFAQALVTANRNLYYHTWYQGSNNHPYEIDFLITNNKGKLWVFEVKSSNTGRHKSIDEFMRKFSSKIDKAILTSQDDISNKGMLLYYPINLIPALLDKDNQN